MIQRWRAPSISSDENVMMPDSGGRYVLYSDHQSLLAAKEEELRGLKREIEILKVKGYVCTHCDYPCRENAGCWVCSLQADLRAAREPLTDQEWTALIGIDSPCQNWVNWISRGKVNALLAARTLPPDGEEKET